MGDATETEFKAHLHSLLRKMDAQRRINIILFFNFNIIILVLILKLIVS